MEKLGCKLDLKRGVVIAGEGEEIILHNENLTARVHLCNDTNLPANPQFTMEEDISHKVRVGGACD